MAGRTEAGELGDGRKRHCARLDQRLRALRPGLKHIPVRSDAGGGFEFAREMKDAETGERREIGDRNVVSKMGVHEVPNFAQLCVGEATVACVCRNRLQQLGASGDDVRVHQDLRRAVRRLGQARQFRHRVHQIAVLKIDHGMK